MSKAIIWIASGEQFIDEAIVSARSVKKHNPDIPRILCTHLKKGQSYKNFDDLIALKPHRHDLWYLDCTQYLVDITEELEGIEQILLLDTDTYACDDLSDHFRMLDRFDIAGTYAPGRETAPTVYQVPASFPELHIGALVFNRNLAIKELFDLWLKLYQENANVYLNNDQAPLREALWLDPRVQVGIMPPEFCFRFPFGGFLRGKCKVLHGRSKISYQQIDEIVNREWRKMRTFARGRFR